MTQIGNGEEIPSHAEEVEFSNFAKTGLFFPRDDSSVLRPSMKRRSRNIKERLVNFFRKITFICNLKNNKL